MAESDDALARARKRYVDLLKRSLRGVTSFDNELRIRYLRKCLEGRATWDPAVLHEIRRHDPEETMRFAIAKVLGTPLDLDLANIGYDYTMIGSQRLDNIEQCFHGILADGVPGDFIECGVWRGGSVVFMCGLLEAYEVPDRRVWVADSFEGVPPPSAAPDVALGLDLSREKCLMLAVDAETVMRAFEVHGLWNARVQLLPGWFKETLPRAPIEQLALLRLDGDIYESTMDALVALYDRLVPGGFVIIDDFFIPTCRQAVEEFRAARGIHEPIVTIDWAGAYWRRAR
jgi:hypothetical protein